MAAGGEIEPHEGVAGRQQSEEHSLVHLASRIGLHVGEAGAEQLLGALDRQRLDDVDIFAAAIIAPAGIALRIFVGEDRTLRLEHRFGDDVLGSDQLDLVALAAEFERDRLRDFGIGRGERVGEEAGRLRLACVQSGAAAHSGSLAKSGLESLSIRRSWRPPANEVARKASRQAPAISMPIMRPPMARTLASLCSRASRAESGSATSAQRQAGWRLAAIEMPIPEPHKATPISARPGAIPSAGF